MVDVESESRRIVVKDVLVASVVIVVILGFYGLLKLVSLVANLPSP